MLHLDERGADGCVVETSVHTRSGPTESNHRGATLLDTLHGLSTRATEVLYLANGTVVKAAAVLRTTLLPKYKLLYCRLRPSLCLSDSRVTIKHAR